MYNLKICSYLPAMISEIFAVYHWDLPNTLQYGTVKGWPDSRIIPVFLEFAEFCFKEFGNRVKKWITFNEPWVVCYQGYEIAVRF